jgi:hypothetical protein
LTVTQEKVGNTKVLLFWFKKKKILEKNVIWTFLECFSRNVDHRVLPLPEINTKKEEIVGNAVA